MVPDENLDTRVAATILFIHDGAALDAVVTVLAVYVYGVPSTADEVYGVYPGPGGGPF